MICDKIEFKDFKKEIKKIIEQLDKATDFLIYSQYNLKKITKKEREDLQDVINRFIDLEYDTKDLLSRLDLNRF